MRRFAKAGSPRRGGHAMRILLLLTDGYGCPGGIARVNLDLIDALSGCPAVEEIVVLPRRSMGRPDVSSAKLVYDDRASRGVPHYLARCARWMLMGRRFDLVICTHVNLQPLAWVASRANVAPSALFLHGIEAWVAPRNWLSRLTVGGAHWYLAATELTLGRARSWLRIPRSQSITLPFCVDLARFTPGHASAAVIEKYRLDGAIVLLTLGRLAAAERYKGYDEILEILSQLRSVERRLIYVIAGDGDDRVRLQSKALALGVADQVRFTGWVSEDEKVELYRAARAFALAGRGEGFGIVLLEALACGVPVVASTLDGSFEAIKNGQLGIVVDPRDPLSLRDGILEALRRPVGVRLPGLEYFSREEFRERVRNAVLRMVEPGRRIPVSQS
jgi:phosphatidyl-myo-inositol dimannoside synthase